MNMGGHKDIGVKEERIKLFVILSGFENLCALIPPGDDVIRRS